MKKNLRLNLYQILENRRRTVGGKKGDDKKGRQLLLGKNRGDTVRKVNYALKKVASFSGENRGDTISLPPRMTPTLVTPLCGSEHWTRQTRCSLRRRVTDADRQTHRHTHRQTRM